MLLLSDDSFEKELLFKAKSGDSDAVAQIIEKYYSKASSAARRFFVTGADESDLLQEALIALFVSITAYDPSKGESFEAYASVCIRNRLISYIKSANRMKNGPLNTSVSLDDTLVSGDDPYQRIIDMETLEEYRRQIGKKLTKKEKTVLSYYLSGLTYSEIADKCGISEKAVDNVIYRVKKKLKNSA